MGLNVSSAMWQQCLKISQIGIDTKDIMDDAMFFSERDHYSEDLANLFKALIKFGLKISTLNAILKIIGQT